MATASRNGLAGPRAGGRDIVETTTGPSSDQMQRLSKAYRNLVLSFGAQLVLSVMNASVGLLDPVTGLIWSLMVLAGMVGTVVALVYFGYRTAEAMASSAPWTWAVAMLVPCANAITLLVLSSRATRMCRQAGIPVGLLGPKL
jgi:hypothetical protein